LSAEETAVPPIAAALCKSEVTGADSTPIIRLTGYLSVVKARMVQAIVGPENWT
jgi:hypothetical protein